jgi:integrase/recombinase XerD
MGKRGDRKPRPWNPASGLEAWSEKYIAYKRERNYSERTLRIAEVYLRYFIAWCDARSLSRPEEITRPILERYQRHLFVHRKTDGHPLSWRSQTQRVRVLRGYFRWLVRQNVLLSNPAADLELPREEKRLPRSVLTALEMEQVLSLADTSMDVGVRDRAIMETLYSTGIRRFELVQLKMHDVDHERGTIFIRLGKGKKDRIVPIGERALRWIDKYVHEVRPRYECGRDQGEVFLAETGDTLSPEYLTHRIRREYVDAAKLGKRGSCHLFRHTMATVMLEGGADVRHVQEMLGHAHLKSTDIYTHVSVKHLKEVHARTHPSSSLASRASTRPVAHEDDAHESREDLFDALASEDDDA